MNTLLNAAEKWFSEIGIATIARPTCLMVNRNDLTEFGTSGEMLAELRSGINSTKVYWSTQDDDYFYLESF